MEIFMRWLKLGNNWKIILLQFFSLLKQNWMFINCILSILFFCNESKAYRSCYNIIASSVIKTEMDIFLKLFCLLIYLEKCHKLWTVRIRKLNFNGISKLLQFPTTTSGKNPQQNDFIGPLYILMFFYSMCHHDSQVTDKKKRLNFVSSKNEIHGIIQLDRLVIPFR